MKEPVLFKTQETLPIVDRRELVVATGESRFAFLEVKNAEGISEHVITAHENSKLEFVMLQNVSAELNTLTKVKLRAHKGAHVKFTFIQNGGKYAHFEIDTEVLGEGSDVEVRGLQYAKHQQKLSFEAKTSHAVPHSRSDLQVWCIANDEAHSIFNGVITIEKGAHHTEAYQKNKNLLLSNRATVDTFPKLFIYNHDVKCAHGSSVSQLDADQFYYLQSRGIDRAAAEQMLLSGFLHQAFSWISDDASKLQLEKLFHIEEEGL